MARLEVRYIELLKQLGKVGVVPHKVTEVRSVTNVTDKPALDSFEVIMQYGMDFWTVGLLNYGFCSLLQIYTYAIIHIFEYETAKGNQKSVPAKQESRKEQ